MDLVRYQFSRLFQKRKLLTKYSNLLPDASAGSTVVAVVR